MTAALGIVYRTIATHLAQKAGFTKTMAQSQAGQTQKALPS